MNKTRPKTATVNPKASTTGSTFNRNIDYTQNQTFEFNDRSSLGATNTVLSKTAVAKARKSQVSNKTPRSLTSSARRIM